MIGAEQFWDKAAAKYAKSPIKNMAAYQTTLERVRAHLNSQDRVLEMGCGTGTTALALAAAVGQLTAIDISARMIEIAADKAAQENHDNLRFLQAELADHRLPAGGYDVVMAFNVLHLLRDMPDAVGRIHGLLRPGGLFISKTVCMAEKRGIWPVLLFVMQLLRMAPYVRFLKTEELQAEITAQGFEVLETGDYPATPPSRFIVARKI